MMIAAARADLGWVHDPALLIVLVLGAAAYGTRWRQLRRESPHVVSRVDLVWFSIGVATVAGAWLTPLDPIGNDYLLSAHMVQTLLLIAAAPPLILRGCTTAITAPLRALWEPSVRRLPALRHPTFLLAAGVITIVGWHAVPVYDLVVRNPALHALEQVTVVLAGLAVTWPLVSAPRGGREMGGIAPIFYLVALEFGVGILGVWLAWYPHVAYDWYADAPRMFGLEAQSDQAVAGAMLLVTEEPVLLVEFGVLFLRMLAKDEEQQRLRDAEEL